MPTPSTNPSTDRSSPSPHSFQASTCPDDLQQSGHPSQDDLAPVGSREGRRDSIHSAGASAAGMLSALSGQDGLSLDEVLVLDGTTPTEMSRASTMSPRPQSGVTNTTSPTQTTSDSEPVKPVYKSDMTCDLAGTESTTPQRSHVGSSATPSRDVDNADGTSTEDHCCGPWMGLDFSNRRTIPKSPSSYLRPGSRFHGTQQSERQVYDVQVEIKHVDMKESFMCGYLRIQGLTEDHPTLTTYFEGEIIGSKYSFFTEHEDWGANAKVDLSHWAKFTAFRPLQKHAKTGQLAIQDASQKENIFMRWKEHFLVPDHRVRTISGASFEGFYYICFNQVKGEVSGIYFHSKSERFQQLELKHVPDRGCFSASEFR